MKKILIIILLLISLKSGCQILRVNNFYISKVTEEIDLENGLVSYWQLDETSGDAIDEIELNDLTVSGATQNQSGKIGTAYTFDGSDYLGGVDTDYEFINVFSISAWIKTSTTAEKGFVTNFHWTGDGYSLQTNYQAKLQLVVWNTGATPSNIAIIGTTVLSDDAWHHIVGTFDGTNLRIYVDGEIEGTSADWANDITYNSSNRFRIGDRGGSLNFIGSIDEVGIWKGF